MKNKSKSLSTKIKILEASIKKFGDSNGTKTKTLKALKGLK